MGWTHRVGRGVLAALLAPGLAAQEPMEMGPISTREMFPLYLPTLAYQPVDPTPVGQGRWRVALDTIWANTFEFSDIFKTQAPRDAQGRVTLTREFVLAHAADYATVPVIFFFDEEISRTTLRVRYGLTANTDLWAELPFQSHGGGYLDNVIEGFHSLGFEQFGRDRIAKNRLTLVVMTRGNLDFYSDQTIRGKTQDSLLGVVHRFLDGPTWSLSAQLTLKPPTTTTYDVYRSGWDHSLGLTGRWQPAPRHVLYYGGAYVGRPPGSTPYNQLAFGGMRNGWGAHGTWEYRRWPRFRPFLQLYAQSGYLQPQLYQKLDRGSLQHDLGFHWPVWKNATLTFRYLNNITHNENTADMGLGLSLTAAF